MAYFKKFPRIEYSFDDGQNTKTAVDILTRVAVKDKIKNTHDMFIEYDVQDGERPDTLADRFYGDSDLHWVILLFNDIVNPYYGFPLSSKAMDNYLKSIYPGETYFLLDAGSGGFANIHYNRNETILGVSGSEVIFTNGVGTHATLDGENAARCHSWDKSYSRLVVTGVSGAFNAGDFITTRGTSADGTPVFNVAKIGRKVSVSSQAAHHFEDIIGSTSEDTISHLSTPPDSDGTQYPLGQSGSTGAAVPFGDTILQNYIVDSTDTYTITNANHEHKKNDSRRSIKLLKPKYVARVAGELGKVIRGRLNG